MITLDRVHKAYANGTLALADISFSVAEGEFVSVVGPSGSGKSTLLRIISGLGPVSSGTVLVEGKPPRQARRERTDTAFVFQDPTLMPWRNVRANVELPLELRATDATQRRTLAMRALELVGLADVEHAYPRELSGGMRMRVSLARALAGGPHLLLMDEPFGALDEITRQRLNVELLRICAMASWTVVYVTHNVFEAVFLSKRILVMSRQPGRIVAEVAVQLPYPRLPQVRSTPEYSHLVGEVVKLLEDA